MDEQNRPEPTAAAPARESHREGGPQQDQRAGAPPFGGGRRRDGGRRHRAPGERPQQQSQQGRPEASLNMDELRELFTLFNDQGFTEFELEREGFRVRIRRDLSPPAAAHHAPPALGAQMFTTPQTFAAPQATTGQQGATQPAAGTPAPPPATAAPTTEPEVELYTIPSPIVGTFYRASSPTAEPFVNVGSRVEQETVVCIIEAMKLMNEILAETSGVVEKIYVENGQPVEYGQPLFGVRR
jgi:acetyl-CoA carboxylase biotin carboxyl carrier protein